MKGIELDVRLKLEVELLGEITRDRSEDNAKYTLVHRRNSALFGDSFLTSAFFTFDCLMLLKNLSAGGGSANSEFIVL